MQALNLPAQWGRLGIGAGAARKDDRDFWVEATIVKSSSKSMIESPKLRHLFFARVWSVILLWLSEPLLPGKVGNAGLGGKGSARFALESV
eukprot:5972081-Amphidinium_carterae.2